MKIRLFAALVAATFGVAHGMPADAAGTVKSPGFCAKRVGSDVPARARKAMPGSRFVQEVRALRGVSRDALVEQQILSGNVPEFLWHLKPVTFSKVESDGLRIDVTICVTPDYMAVGDDGDYVRVPMGLPAAARIASELGFLLPTTKMVDEIYAQAEVRLDPSPMRPGSAMESTDYFVQHNHTVEQQRNAFRSGPTALTAGQKKDLVLSNRMRAKPGRVAIYGWHRRNGAPIQSLSTVHGKNYADYSHGVRLVSDVAYVNGYAWPLEDILRDPMLAPIISNEGPILQPGWVLASLR